MSKGKFKVKKAEAEWFGRSGGRDHDGLVGWLDDGGGGIRMKSRLCAFGSFDFCFYAAVWSAHSSSHVSAVAFMF